MRQALRRNSLRRSAGKLGIMQAVQGCETRDGFLLS